MAFIFLKSSIWWNIYYIVIKIFPICFLRLLKSSRINDWKTKIIYFVRNRYLRQNILFITVSCLHYLKIMVFRTVLFIFSRTIVHESKYKTQQPLLDSIAQRKTHFVKWKKRLNTKNFHITKKDWWVKIQWSFVIVLNSQR